MNYINFDIETYSPSNATKIDTNEFRVSVAGAYISWIDKYIAFLENDVVDLLNLMLRADLIVGFNQLWFDLPVLQKYASYDLLKLPNFDILKEFEKKAGFKSKLNDLCKWNLQDDIKTDSYDQYRHYYKDGKWFELIDYCMNDVRLTESLFRQILDKKPVVYYNLQERKEVLLDQPIPQKALITETMDTIF